MWAITTDSTLINGDSGGPVFDLDGRLVGINSRIGLDPTQNIHVPIDTFLATWERLAAGQEWDSMRGGFAGGRGRGGGAGGPGVAGGGRARGERRQWGRAGVQGAGGLAGGSNSVTPAAVMPPSAPRLGFGFDDNAKGVVITYISPGTPADSVDLQPDDIITKVNGQAVKTGNDLKVLATKLRPGDSVTLDLLRGTQTKRLLMKVGSEN